MWFIFRSENAHHLSIENLDTDVLKLGFILYSLGFGVVSKLGVLGDVEINIGDRSFSIVGAEEMEQPTRDIAHSTVAVVI
jgi:hypothetical protein